MIIRINRKINKQLMMPVRKIQNEVRAISAIKVKTNLAMMLLKVIVLVLFVAGYGVSSTRLKMWSSG